MLPRKMDGLDQGMKQGSSSSVEVSFSNSLAKSVAERNRETEKIGQAQGSTGRPEGQHTTELLH